MKRMKFSLILTLALAVTTTLIPSAKAKAADNPPPQITGLSAITLDVKTGEIIYAKGIDEKRYPASITKLMTALLFAENKQKTDLIPYTEDANKQPQYALRTDVFKSIKVGDTMPAEDVMKAMLLFSANDSAYMAGDSVAGTTDKFIQMMNDKASELGMKNTHFVTANGLHDPNHYTTAYDLTILGRKSLSNPWIKEVSAIKQDTITFSKTGQTFPFENRNKNIGQDGCIGGKTGYTDPAKRCLLALYERDGRQIIGVILQDVQGATDTAVFNNMKTIIDWSYSAQKTVAKPKDTVVEHTTLEYKPLKFFGPTKKINVDLVIKDDVTYYANDVNKKELTFSTNVDKLDPWKLSTDQSVGSYAAKQREAVGNYKIYPTINTSEIVAQNKGLYIAVGVGAFAALVVLVLLIILVKKGLSRGGKKSYY
ncbi:MAG: D-alanyl-D-alanine carboxypeptidase family protein [Bacillota bacterium]|nr:D-alanyl-D-alanine carboxypeptidase family protein [Bacillota bacterium]